MTWTCTRQVRPRDPQDERHTFSHVGLRAARAPSRVAFPDWPPCSQGGVSLCGWRPGGRGPGGLGPKHWGCKAGTRGAAPGLASGTSHNLETGVCKCQAAFLPRPHPPPREPQRGRTRELRGSRVQKCCQPHGKPLLVRGPVALEEPTCPWDLAAAPRAGPGEHRGRGGGLGPSQGHPVGAGPQGGWGLPWRPHIHHGPCLPPPAAPEIGWSDGSEEPQQGTALKTSELRGGISRVLMAAQMTGHFLVHWAAGLA